MYMYFRFLRMSEIFLEMYMYFRFRFLISEFLYQAGEEICFLKTEFSYKRVSCIRVFVIHNKEEFGRGGEKFVGNNRVFLYPSCLYPASTVVVWQ